MSNIISDDEIDEMEEEEDEERRSKGSLLVMVGAFLYMKRKRKAHREPSIRQQRLQWTEFKELYASRKEYTRHMRMPQEDFETLLGLVKDRLSVDEKQSLRRGLSPIIPEIKLYCLIRWLAGGQYSDICLYVKISVASFYRVVWEALDAVNEVTELELKFPRTVEECMESSEQFTTVSYGGAITNCVSVIDGYTPQIYTPPKKVVGNVRSYFSGHKKYNCVNVQAACDAFCRFQFLGVAASGSTNDRRAVRQCALYSMIQSLPGSYVAIGDAAYQPAEHLCPLY